MAVRNAQAWLLFHLFFVMVAIRWSHAMHCEARDDSQEERLYPATDTSLQLGSVSEDVESLRPLNQSDIDLENFEGTAAKNQEHVDSGNELESEEVETYFNTSGAGFIYSGESEEEQGDADIWPHLVHRTVDSSNCVSTGNYIDDCWRCDSNWQDRRQQLASCGLGFGKSALGGQGGQLYVVTSSGDDLKAPAQGTLRYGATSNQRLWIVFARSMTIQLKGALKLTSFKTIDGRGAAVHLVGPSQISIMGITNVIVHGIYVHDIVRVEGQFEGDAIHIRNSSKVWIDHCYLARAYDGLVDVTKNSTAVTVSNCFFENHSKVMLFGASPDDDYDRNMQVTVAFNKFGANLTQRMPRCRYGNCHVANNFYTSGWKLYAIGGSEDPTILSQANHFVAPDDSDKKEVTQRLDDDGPTFGGWEKWDWMSANDSFSNGAFFRGSGVQNEFASNYDRARSFVPRQVALVTAMTKDAGPLSCSPKTICSGAT